MSFCSLRDEPSSPCRDMCSGIRSGQGLRHGATSAFQRAQAFWLSLEKQSSPQHQLTKFSLHGSRAPGCEPVSKGALRDGCR
eukprot:1143499-Amphidinium_carterae.1